MRTWQINLQRHLGGGEIFTAFLTRALDRLDVPTTLFVRHEARYWPSLNLPSSTEIVPVANADEIDPRLPRGRAWLLGHGPLPAELAADARHLRTVLAHMPPQGRDPRAFDRHDLVLPISQWVLEGLRAIGAPAWDEPLYGVADARGSAGEEVRSGPVYDFDRRKLRDRVLGWIYPFSLRGSEPYGKRPGLTLGIVSRLTPIKQFPAQFAILAPLIAARAGVNLEIFGAGGYASVRDLKRALRPLGARARFWGHQQNVAAVYAGLDYLMTGLPEKEALGLNVIEAQACGLPVLAVAAPPFNETMIDGGTGYLYRDPRADGGADFSRLLDALLSGKPRPDPRRASGHLERFTFDAFTARVARLVEAIRSRIKA